MGKKELRNKEIDTLLNQMQDTNKKGILSKIKSFFQRLKNKTLALPETTVKINQIDENNLVTQKPQSQQVTIEQRKEFRRELKEIPKVTSYNINTIEGAIQQYISSFVVLSKEGKVSPYRALVELAGKEEKGQSHLAEQNATIYNLRQRKYLVQEQAHNGNVAFFHIRNNSYMQDKQSGNIRLYLNPTRQNTLPLVREILNKMGNAPIYLKFSSDDQMNKLSRSEKIVIYTDDQKDRNGRTNLSNVMNVINQIKRENMNLFVGCEMMNPFMKRIEGVAGIAPQPTGNMYKLLNGKLKPVAQSYNSFLAEALNESVTMAANEITVNMQQFNNLSLEQKLQNLLVMCPDKLINRTKVYLQQCQNNNADLDIRGLKKEKQIPKTR